MIAVQKSCIHASAVAVFVEWWIVVFVDNVSFHRGICTLGASLQDGVEYKVSRHVIQITYNSATLWFEVNSEAVK